MVKKRLISVLKELTLNPNRKCTDQKKKNTQINEIANYEHIIAIAASIKCMLTSKHKTNHSSHNGYFVKFLNTQTYL